jgi:hypothetical protein
LAVAEGFAAFMRRLTGKGVTLKWLNFLKKDANLLLIMTI